MVFGSCSDEKISSDLTLEFHSITLKRVEFDDINPKRITNLLAINCFYTVKPVFSTKGVLVKKNAYEQ